MDEYLKYLIILRHFEGFIKIPTEEPVHKQVQDQFEEVKINFKTRNWSKKKLHT